MPGPVFLAGETVELRTIEEEDLDDLQRWINDPAVRGSLGAVRPRNGPAERDWWEAVSEDDSEKHLLVCVDGGAVGVVGLNSIIDVFGTAEVGYFFGPDHWGSGYATDAVRTLVRYAFAERRLAKVYADAYATNEASRRVLEKVGFVEEGVFREQGFVDGERVDMHRYGLLADEWEG